MFYNRKPVDLQDPNKPFTDGGKPMGLTALDYWRFQFSNFWDAQEEVAEFLVAKALGLDLPYNKNGWTTCDILYKGKRVEIKASAYFHSWRGDGKVSKQRGFGIPETVGQHNEKKEVAERQNDVYVFCLNLGDSFESSDPFEMTHWEFYVVPTRTINLECGHQNMISLGRLRKITPEWGRVAYGQLKAAIDAALQLGGSNE